MMNIDTNKLMQNEHLNELGISIYTDALLYGKITELPKKILHHVAECEECKKEILENFALLKDKKLEKEEHPSFGIKSKESFISQSGGNRHVLYKIIRIAAIFILLIGIGYLMFYFALKKSDKAILSDSQITDSLKNNKREHRIISEDRELINYVTDNETEVKIQDTLHLYAQNYIRNSVFEGMIDAYFRSYTRFKILSPANNMEYHINDNITFKWEGVLPGNAHLTVFNNKEQNVYEANISNLQELLLTKRLNYGLFYWKIETEDEIIYLGKFKIVPK